MKKNLISIGLVLSLMATAHARTWTSSDGSKTFSGELLSYDSSTGMVTVKRSNGQEMNFKTEILSADDLTFLNEWEVEQSKSEVDKVLEGQKFGAKLLQAKLNKLNEEKEFETTKLEKTPEYYLVYFTASW